jgi:hypothetical protein
VPRCVGPGAGHRGLQHTAPAAVATHQGKGRPAVHHTAGNVTTHLF